MAYSHYGHVAPFSPLDNNELDRQPSYPLPWSPDFDDGDLSAHNGMEMQNSVRDQNSTNNRGSINSTSSTLFPAPGESNEAQSFLDDPLNRFDANFSGFDNSPPKAPYKDHSGRQLRHLLLGSLVRFLITFALCAAYVLVVREYKNAGVLDETAKKFFNAWTTAISIALGLNIASSFKDMALNMRWPILSSRKRNLLEVGGWEHSCD
ncbi:hypothetical protein BP5796_09124 [Coleophoma crateriformis]|uniref:Uncharacterized protein n=1 Tax=Coleophoma crateriformis TaxID=565419 RepID=A0A3D8R361_9HELO|nr:hypothetical protein BP5796_09124 [Coleophoma crateriformis]